MIKEEALTLASWVSVKIGKASTTPCSGKMFCFKQCLHEAPKYSLPDMMRSRIAKSQAVLLSLSKRINVWKWASDPYGWVIKFAIKGSKLGTYEGIMRAGIVWKFHSNESPSSKNL